MSATDIHLVVNAEPRFLKAVRGLVRGYVQGLEFPHERVDEIVLAVDEACSNSIRHSYRFQESGTVELDMRSNDQEMVIELCDHGTPIPDDKIKAAKPAPPDIATLRPGGLGIPLIYQVFDQVEFYPGEGCGNRVVMHLRRPAALAHERKATEG